MIDLSSREASFLPDAEKRKLIRYQLTKINRDIKRLDTASYIIIITGLLLHDVTIVVCAVLIAYALSEKALALETKKLKLQKQFKHLI